MKKRYKGDGKSLYDAIITSSYRVEEAYTGMGISRGTLYNYFEKEVLDKSIKEAAAKFLKKTVDGIFGQSSTVAEPEVPYRKEGDLDHNANNEEGFSLDLLGTENQETMKMMMEMMRDSLAASKNFSEGYKAGNEAAKIDAEARLITAQALDRLTLMLGGASSPKAKAS